MSLVNHYKDVPIAGRYGSGAYTYKCVVESEYSGVVKVEIFAPSVDIALNTAAQVFGAIAGWTYMNDDMISINFVTYPGATALLWCG